MVVRKACADRAAGPHDAYLFDLDAECADVVSLAEMPSRYRGGSSGLDIPRTLGTAGE